MSAGEAGTGAHPLAGEGGLLSARTRCARRRDFAGWQRDWLAENGLSSEALCASTFLLSEFHAPYQVVWYGLVL